MPAPTVSADELKEAVSPLRENPGAAAVLCDIDGTLAPIAARPEDAEVPQQARSLLSALAKRYALVGCISGRAAAEARRLVGLEELAYSGNHGFEMLSPGASEPIFHSAVAGHERDAAGFVEGFGETVSRAGLRIEDKGPVIALHWRTAPSEEEAEVAAAGIAAEAERSGLHAHHGRKVLEIRPRLELDKGVALVSLLESRPVERALYAGDDRTDADAFRALARLTASGRLASAIRVGIHSDETPREVIIEADLVVAGTEGFVKLLEALAD